MSEIPDAHEQLERAEAAAHHSHDKGDMVVPLSIAIMAVFAAVIGSLEAASAAHAVVKRSAAAIRQGEASDAWSFYQATSVKKNLYELFAQQAGTGADAMRQKADKYAADQENIQRDARAKEKVVKEDEDESEQAMEQHHHLIVATNFIHLAIALASVSMLMNRRWLWYASLASVTIGVGVGVATFVV